MCIYIYAYLFLRLSPLFNIISGIPKFHPFLREELHTQLTKRGNQEGDN